MALSRAIIVILFLSLDAVFTADEKPGLPLICQKCDCSKDKTIDCTYRNLTNIFTDDDWKALNESGEFIYETLTFAHNKIQNLTRFPQIPIKNLDVSYNDISYVVPRAFHDLDDLETLDLSNNQLKSEVLQPVIFEGKYDETTYLPLRKVRKLRLGNNLIHFLDSDIFEHLSHLEELFLNDNPFEKINQATEIALSNIGKLKILDMSAMELSTLPEDLFHAAKTIEFLSLARNGFHQVPAALGDLVNTKELIMDENPINDIDEYNKFPYLPNLEKLSLSYIPNMEIIGDGALSGLTGLKELYAVHNIHLREIHRNAFSRFGDENKARREWPPLEKLWLHNNNISHLDPQILATWNTMKVIDLRANPWSCDCENEWIIQDVVPILVNSSPELTENLICNGPKPMKSKTMKELAEKGSMMRCLDKYGNHPERDGTILIGLLLGICIGIPFTLLLLIFWKRGCFGIFGGKRGPADFSRAYYQRAGVYDDTMHI